MINIELIKNKMSDAQGYYNELEPILKLESKKIIEDNLKFHTVERLFQLIVDTAIDINTHILSESEFKIPDDYQSTFIILAENKILPMDFALKIAPSVGLRNLVIHKYGKVNIKKMTDDIKNEIDQYLDYLKHICLFLEKF
ncbi:MAG: DUF86 domain-containing protein [Patescibacteria group bacterium]